MPQIYRMFRIWSSSATLFTCSVLYFNPGGAGPRRFALRITVGRLHVSEAGVAGEIIKLPV